MVVHTNTEKKRIYHSPCSQGKGHTIFSFTNTRKRPTLNSWGIELPLYEMVEALHNR
jgi:hypothetical protein